MKELKAPEKVTQKMTHDGAVTENLPRARSQISAAGRRRLISLRNRSR